MAAALIALEVVDDLEMLVIKKVLLRYGDNQQSTDWLAAAHGTTEIPED